MKTTRDHHRYAPKYRVSRTKWREQVSGSIYDEEKILQRTKSGFRVDITMLEENHG